MWEIYSEESSVFITPTMEEVRAVINAGADIIAVDAADRMTKEGNKVYELIPRIKEEYPEKIILADIHNAKEAHSALNFGVDMVITILNLLIVQILKLLQKL